MPIYEVVVERTEKSYARTMIEAASEEEALSTSKFIQTSKLRFDVPHKLSLKVTGCRRRYLNVSSVKRRLVEWIL